MSAKRLKPLTFVALLSLLSLISPAAPGQDAAHDAAKSTLSPGFKFAEDGGEELYANVCQACHMPDGKGAIGAGAYPSIAGDKNLEAGRYPVAIVVNGQRAMPPVGELMNDDQVAAVVNYVRTHFGNNYQDAVTAEDVKAARR
jgi:mono/diheme cytochrome c family protein